MNKSELVDRIATDTDVAKSDVEAVLRSFEDTVVATVRAGQRVQLPGFLTFEKGHRAARTARNPQTGAPIQVPAADVPKVKIGKSFKDALAG